MKPISAKLRAAERYSNCDDSIAMLAGKRKSAHGPSITARMPKLDEQFDDPASHSLTHRVLLLPNHSLHYDKPHAVLASRHSELGNAE